MVYYNNNLKIVGGQDSIGHSWPATALIIFDYYFDYRGQKQRVGEMCNGALINRDTGYY